MNHTTTSDAHSIATRHWWLKANGAKVTCPYQQGTRAYQIYKNQMKRMEGLSHGC